MAKGGPDGWRYARVRWPKGVHPSRKIHYFKDGRSLCGAHYDGVDGWYIEPITDLNLLVEMKKCKKCKKALKGEGEA